LIYLRFTQPRRDEAAFAALVEQYRTRFATQAADPAAVFNEAVAAARYQNHPRRRLPNASMVEAMNLDRSLAFYKDRFADANGYTFVFVGSFDLPTLKPLVERYLGGLPSLGRQETWKDLGIRNATGVVEKRLERGLQSQSRTQLIFTGPFQYDQAHRIAIRAMADILQRRLIQVIREQLGGAYAVSVTASYSRIPAQEYAVIVQFGCDPQRTAELTARVFKEIETLKTAGVTDLELSDERKALIREFETSIQTNTYVLTQVFFRYQGGEDPAPLWQLPAMYGVLDAGPVNQAARTYLNPGNVVRVSLFPEK
jgi:zinc protease